MCSIMSSVIEGESVPTKQRKSRREEVTPKSEYPTGTTIRKVLAFASTADHSVYTSAARVSETENCGSTFYDSRCERLCELVKVSQRVSEKLSRVDARDHGEC